MNLVILESPLRGNYELNRRYARACMLDSIQRGEAPLASHLLYDQPGILDDTLKQDRTIGMRLGFAWADRADYVVVYTDLGMSPGMLEGIEKHRRTGKCIILRSIGMGWNNGTT